MSSTSNQSETRKRASAAESRVDAGFKRLALPAVAAAVQALALAKPRKPGHQEWPAVRRDGRPN